jgi:hypothetical protein
MFLILPYWRKNFMSENTNKIVRDFPVWRDKSNFILAVRLKESDVPDNWKWEQIWVRQMEENLFEVCCMRCEMV